MLHQSGRAGGYSAYALTLIACVSIVSPGPAQEAGIPAGPSGAEPSAVSAPATEAPTPTTNRLNFFWLMMQGGIIMIPIGLTSVVAVAIVIEQLFSLRTERVMPRRLIDELSERADQGRLLDPRRAYQICQEYPSVASRVLRAALLKVGRPQAEIEQAVNEHCQREADRMHAHVRWLYMITAIAPLLGLLGTVWGMIQSFYDMTQLTGGQNRATFLAAGIYIALVTTFAGLTVAIPTAVAAHIFEGRIVLLLHRIAEFVGNLLPQWEPYEGQVRVAQPLLRQASTGHPEVADEVGAPTARPEPRLSPSP